MSEFKGVNESFLVFFFFFHFLTLRFHVLPKNHQNGETKNFFFSSFERSIAYVEQIQSSGGCSQGLISIIQ